MQPTTLPIFPLGTVLFPNALLPLHIFEERYRRMLRDSSHLDPAFVVARIDEGSSADPRPTPTAIGTACRVTGLSPHPDGRSDIVVTGTNRVRIGELDWSNGYAVSEVEPLDDVVEDADQVDADFRLLVARFRRYLDALERLIGDQLPALEPARQPGRGTWLVGETLTLHVWERQRLLDAATVDDRIARLQWYLRREYALLRQTGMIGNPIDFPGRNLTLN